MKEVNIKAYTLAYQKIKDMLFNLEIKPGETISELNLSKELGLSRTPIREAMRTLEQEGIIISVNGRKKVPSFSLTDIQQIFELKLAIECNVVELATNRQTVAQKKHMILIRDKIQRLYDIVVADPDRSKSHFPEWDVIDKEFHALTFEMAGNERARSIVENLNLQWHRFRMGLFAMENRLITSMDEHIEIANLMILNKAQEAREKIEEHIKRLYSDVLSSSNMFLQDC